MEKYLDNLENELIDRLTKSYFDNVFENLIFRRENEHSDWYGFFKPNNKLILGKKDDDGRDLKSGIFYYDGLVFMNDHEIFSLSKEKFYNSMLRYLNKKYGMNISKII